MTSVIHRIRRNLKQFHENKLLRNIFCRLFSSFPFDFFENLV